MLDYPQGGGSLPVTGLAFGVPERKDKYVLRGYETENLTGDKYHREPQNYVSWWANDWYGPEDQKGGLGDD